MFSTIINNQVVAQNENIDEAYKSFVSAFLADSTRNILVVDDADDSVFHSIPVNGDAEASITGTAFFDGTHVSLDGDDMAADIVNGLKTILRKGGDILHATIMVEDNEVFNLGYKY